MINHTSILSGTLVDYTDWLVNQRLPPGSPNELRGIFYNKLTSRLKEVYPGPDVRNAITVEDIIILFTTRGHILTIKFSNSPSISRPAVRNDILNGLNEALLSIDVTDYHDKLSYELSKVIIDLKKSLNYGREQTSKY